MDGVPLDRAGPDDRDFHHQVVQVLRPRLGERLHLGPALDLEDAHGIGCLEHREDFRDLLRQAIEVEADGTVVLDELERLIHRREHPETQQVQLDQLERLDVALVELDDHPIRHRRPLKRGDVDEWRRSHEHPARVDGEVAREAIDPGAELQPALPVAEAHRRTATRLRWRLRFNSGDRGVRRRRVPAVGPAEPVRRARRWLRHAAFGIDRPALDERRRDELVAFLRVPSAATGT